jgi:uncharacterized protein (TIGR02246 family)
MKRLAASLTVVVALLASLAAAQQLDPAVEKLNRAYEAAFNKADARGIAALHTTTAQRLLEDGQLLTGRAAIEKAYADALAGPLKGAKLTIHPGDVQQLAPDVASGAGIYEITGGKATRKGRYMSTMKREAGEWRLATLATIVTPPATK